MFAFAVNCAVSRTVVQLLTRDSVTEQVKEFWMGDPEVTLRGWRDVKNPSTNQPTNQVTNQPTSQVTN